MSKVNGKTIRRMAQEMYGTDKITQSQLAYILDMLQPSTYMLRNHTIAGKPLTFSIPNRDSRRALAHRPWQQSK